jgi:hypothetical protein
MKVLNQSIKEIKQADSKYSNTKNSNFKQKENNRNACRGVNYLKLI